MNVPTYQIHNILTVYCRKLQQRMQDKEAPSKDTESKALVRIIALSKRETVINKVTAGIINKITRSGTQNSRDIQHHDVPEAYSPKTRFFLPDEKHEFRYVHMAADGGSSTRRLRLDKAATPEGTTDSPPAADSGSIPTGG